MLTSVPARWRAAARRFAAAVVVLTMLSAGAQQATAAPSGELLSTEVVSNPSHAWVLVNKSRPLNPRQFAPSDLVSWNGGNHLLRRQVAGALTQLFAGAALEFQVGYDSGDTIEVSTTALANFASGASLAAATITDSNTVQGAITEVSTQRAELGALQNRFEHTVNSVNVAIENLSASESRIRDTDMAQEMVNFTRAQILSQAGTAMLAQANQAPQGVLQLLR